MKIIITALIALVIPFSVLTNYNIIINKNIVKGNKFDNIKLFNYKYSSNIYNNIEYLRRVQYNA